MKERTNREIVIILGRERDFEPGEFGLKFDLGGLVDERQFAEVLSGSREMLNAKTDFPVLDEGVPARSNFRRFSSHKV